MTCVRAVLSWTHTVVMISGLVVNRTKSSDILESAMLVMMTSVWVVGSSPVRNQRSSYCIGHGDCMSVWINAFGGQLTVRLTDDSATWSLTEMEAEP